MRGEQDMVISAREDGRAEPYLLGRIDGYK